MARHVPRLPTIPHDMQAPSQVLAQQTRWAQTPLTHSGPASQAAPLGLRPHEPISHTAGAAQSMACVAVVHADLHVPAPHANGKHDVDAGVTHAPAPSHVDSGVSVVPFAGQLAAWQGVP
jgi:hypothetical protein